MMPLPPLQRMVLRRTAAPAAAPRCASPVHPRIVRLRRIGPVLHRRCSGFAVRLTADFSKRAVRRGRAALADHKIFECHQKTALEN